MGCGGSRPSSSDLVLNLEAEPNEEEVELFQKVKNLLDQSPELIEKLEEYQSCEKYIKNALSDPSSETESEAWKAVEKAVDRLYKFYIFTLNLDQTLPEVLGEFLDKDSAKVDATSLIEKHPALVKLLAGIFSYAILFDERKMSNPAIQNDFSYYRRVLSRMRHTGNGVTKKKKKVNKVNEEVANKMSFHFAYPAPVMKVLTETFVILLNNEKFENINQILITLAHATCFAIEKNEITNELRAELLHLLTGCIIFVDHSTPQGVFAKKSPMNIKKCLSTIRDYGGESKDSLFNEIKFGSLHFRDEENLSPSLKKVIS